MGKWNLKQRLEKVFLNNAEVESDSELYEAGAYVEFKSDGNVLWNEDNSDPEEFIYKVEGNKLTITAEEADEFEIQTLTDSKLIISSAYSYTEEESGQPVRTFKGTAVTTLER